MTQRYVPVVLSLFMVLGPLSGAALAAEAPQSPQAPGAAAAPALAPRALTLTGINNNDTITTRLPVFSGAGAVANDVVTVWPESGEALCTSAVVGADGAWTCTPTRELALGEQILFINETTPGAPASKALLHRRIFVKPDAAPTDDKPCTQKDEKK
jgi:hypothetical protein